MKESDFKQLVLINLWRIDVNSASPDLASWESNGREWKLSKTMIPGYPEIKAVCVGTTKQFKAWVYRTKDDPCVREYRNSGFSVDCF